MEAWLLHIFNWWVARSPATFAQALEWVAHLPWLLTAVTLTALWFMGERGAVPTRPGSRTRLQNRRQVLLLVMALPVAYLIARWLQMIVTQPRPFLVAPLQIPIDPATWEKISSGLAASSSFPSYEAIVLFVVAPFTFGLRPYGGATIVMVALYLGSLSVGLGIYWPGDIVAGATLGIVVSGLFLALEPLLFRPLHFVVLQFEYHPHWTYPLGFLALLIFMQNAASLTGLSL